MLRSLSNHNGKGDVSEIVTQKKGIRGNLNLIRYK